MKANHLTVSERATYRSLEDVVGCKWSAAVVAALGRGVHCPGELERFIPGISTKVLTERLRKMLAYRLIPRTEYPGLPLRVEYRLTPIGQKLAADMEQLRALETEHSRSETNATPNQTVQRTGASRSAQETNRTSSAAGSRR